MDAKPPPIKCQLCYRTYNSQARKPMTVSCGHTFCKACIVGIHHDGQLHCPLCRLRFNASSDRAQVNRLALKSVKAYMQGGLGRRPGAAHTALGYAAGLDDESDMVRSVLHAMDKNDEILHRNVEQAAYRQRLGE